MRPRHDWGPRTLTPGDPGRPISLTCIWCDLHVEIPRRPAKTVEDFMLLMDEAAGPLSEVRGVMITTPGGLPGWRACLNEEQIAQVAEALEQLR